MVLVPLEHGPGPVHHTRPPLRQAPRHIPAGVNPARLLPGAVALQIGLVHHIDAVFVAQMIPSCLVGIVAGADRIDVVPAEGVYGGLHVP